MKKKWLHGINVILGAMSFGLLGTSCDSHEYLYGPAPIEKYGCPEPEEMVMLKYGSPAVLDGQIEQVGDFADPMPEETKK